MLMLWICRNLNFFRCFCQTRCAQGNFYQGKDVFSFFMSLYWNIGGDIDFGLSLCLEWLLQVRLAIQFLSANWMGFCISCVCSLWKDVNFLSPNLTVWYTFTNDVPLGICLVQVFHNTSCFFFYHRWGVGILVLCFYTPVFRRDVLWYSVVRLSVRAL
jgi:hypothetical protein